MPENGTANCRITQIITTPGFPELDPEATASLDDSPIPYTLTPEGDAAAHAYLAKAGLEPEAGAMTNLDPGVPWTPPTAEEQARWYRAGGRRERPLATFGPPGPNQAAA